jgi:hypothetical protein
LRRQFITFLLDYDISSQSGGEIVARKFDAQGDAEVRVAHTTTKKPLPA